MMTEIVWRFDVEGNNFELAGHASQQTKSRLKQIGVNNDIIRKVIIAMYEGEINMVIHANGGVATVTVQPNLITVVLADTGKGIENVELAMKEGYSTATTEIRELGFGAGMGLPNMKKYSDDMAIDTTVGEGTTITMKFKI
ncbi:MAG TPA: ATP-binding protein [Eubacteriales bacterium]|nr:ATP-binding protein [Clostridia bacterium]HRX14077.1 ATP-binding protein [Eubacteriales bacterium]